jgi:hypothetical protein
MRSINQDSVHSNHNIPRKVGTSLQKDVYSIQRGKTMHNVYNKSYNNERTKFNSVEPKLMEKEFNNYLMQPNKQLLVERVVGCNRQLLELQDEYLTLSRSSQYVLVKTEDVKKKELAKKQKELDKIVEELKSKGISIGPSLEEQNQRKFYEDSLDTGTLKLRKKKIFKLRKLDERCRELQNELEKYQAGEFWMASDEEHQRKLVAKEIMALTTSIEKEGDNELIFVMKKMIRTLNLLN